MCLCVCVCVWGVVVGGGSHNNRKMCQTQIAADISPSSRRITTMKWALNTHLMMMYWKQACPIIRRPSQRLRGDGRTSACWLAGPCHVRRSVRCILKALWKQLNVWLMARSWQNDCTIELAVMMAHITR